MNELKWRKTDASIVLINCPKHAELELYYARTYTSGAGYKHSETNNLINNLKRPVDRPENQLAYKRQSIDRFAFELTEFIKRVLKPGRKVFLVPTPPSKTKDHREYDNRVDQVATKVAANINEVILFPIVLGNLDLEAAHESQASRETEIILKSLTVDQALIEKYEKGVTIAILDDVLTSGAHFSAMRQLLLTIFPDSRLIGLFWARSEDLGE